MKRKPTSFSYSNRFLLTAIAFLSVMSISLYGVNSFNNPTPRDSAFAQDNNPDNPSDRTETTLVPIIGGSSTGGTTASTAPTNNEVTPETPATTTENIQEESTSLPTTTSNTTNIPTATGSTTVSTQNNTSISSTNNESKTIIQTDATPRSGAFEVSIAAAALLLVTGAYWYYQKRGNTKHTLKMAESKIKTKKK